MQFRPSELRSRTTCEGKQELSLSLSLGADNTAFFITVTRSQAFREVHPTSSHASNPDYNASLQVLGHRDEGAEDVIPCCLVSRPHQGRGRGEYGAMVEWWLAWQNRRNTQKPLLLSHSVHHESHTRSRGFRTWGLEVGVSTSSTKHGQEASFILCPTATNPPGNITGYWNMRRSRKLYEGESVNRSQMEVKQV
jgi:hypothetical protein